MLEAQPNNASTPVTKGGKALAGHPWTEQEFETLRTLARGTCTKDDFERYFPHRTLSSCKQKMTVIRKELRAKGEMLNTITRMRTGRRAAEAFLDPDEPGDIDTMAPLWRRKAIVSNARFLEALKRAGFYCPARG